jgi:hypothetical protein
MAKEINPTNPTLPDDLKDDLINVLKDALKDALKVRQTVGQTIGFQWSAVPELQTNASLPQTPPALDSG